LPWSDSLKVLVCAHLKIAPTASIDCAAFRKAMMTDHVLAMEYIARLLRFTVAANGPVRDKLINLVLEKNELGKRAYAEVFALLP